MAHPRTRAQLEADPRVDEVWKEHTGGTGMFNTEYEWWVYLAEGCYWEGARQVHEATLRDCLEEMKRVDCR